MMMFVVSIIGFLIVLISVSISVELLCAMERLKEHKYFIYIYANCIVFFVFAWIVGVINPSVKMWVQIACILIVIITSIILIIRLIRDKIIELRIKKDLEE